MSIRILIADDHGLIRQGLRTLFERAPASRGEAALTVCGEAVDGREAVERSAELSPDVVLMDLSMPDLNGIEATRQVRVACPTCRVVGLSMHGDARRTAAMFEAGASAYLLKDGLFDEVVQAVRAVAAGRTYVSPAIAGELVQGLLVPQSRERGAFSALSGREREVLQLTSEGRSMKEIAKQLHVSHKTVETHRRQVMHKLNLFSVAELTKYAVREGLTSL